MFIDGLDEFDGRYDGIMRMITGLADQTHVKICLSSRPLLAFEEAFGGKPSLRLQDLTFDSIRAYADLQLSEPMEQRITQDEHGRGRARDLLTRIVERADGVFLWAVIAVRKLRDGLQDIVDMDELAQEIENLPSQLEDLFMLILNRIGPLYWRLPHKYCRSLYITDSELQKSTAMPWISAGYTLFTHKEKLKMRPFPINQSLQASWLGRVGS